jgi:hypothetical protein
MTLGELNKGVIALILVMLFGAGGFLWYSQMYKPAVAARTLAQTAESSATAGLTAAKTQLATAQKALDDSKSAAAKPDDAVALLAKSRTAVPDKQLIDDAAIVLMDLATRAGIDTDFKAGSESSNADAGTTEGLSGAQPIDLQFKAAGSYAEMMQFMSLVQGTVVAKDGKLYTHGRLFNVVSLEIGSAQDENGGGGSTFSDGADDSSQASGPVVKPGDIVFTVTVRMYTSSTQNAEDVGTATPDPAASATASADGGATSSTDPSAGGATSSTGSGTGTDPASSSSSTPLAGDDSVAPGGDGAPGGDAQPASTTAGGI